MKRLAHFLLTSSLVFYLAIGAIIIATPFLVWSVSKKTQHYTLPQSFVQKVFADTTVEQATINNLGLGTSDGARIEAYVKKLASNSPIIGHGNEIVQLAKEFGVDPLMIFVFQNESQFCSDSGVVSPGGSDPDNYNCGGITWEAAQIANTTRWHAGAGPQALGHTFAFVPSIMDGVGLYFDYIAKRFPNSTLVNFYNTYNPCDDPGNTGQDCGTSAITKMYTTLKENAGESGDGSGGEVPKNSLTLKLTLKPRSNDTYVINSATAEIIDIAPSPSKASESATQP